MRIDADHSSWSLSLLKMIRTTLLYLSGSASTIFRVPALLHRARLPHTGWFYPNQFQFSNYWTASRFRPDHPYIETLFRSIRSPPLLHRVWQLFLGRLFQN